MKVTLKDIADETGVSQMTVSRILRGKSAGQVSGPVRERVVASLAAHCYDFQQPARKSTALRKIPARKIVAILPYREYLADPPNVNRLTFYRFLEDHCRKNGIRLDYAVGLRNNDNNIPAWEALQKIAPGGASDLHFGQSMAASYSLIIRSSVQLPSSRRRMEYQTFSVILIMSRPSSMVGLQVPILDRDAG